MSSSNNATDDAKTICVTKWTCDVCHIASFDTYEEAEEHENACKGPPPKDDTNQAEENRSSAGQAKTGSASDSSNISKGNLGNDKIEGKSDESKGYDLVRVTKWTCDVCRVAAFDSYYEALEHEKGCKGSPAGSSLPEDPEWIVFAPMVRGPKDSPLYFNLATFNATLLKCVKLQECRMSTDKHDRAAVQRIVTFRCNFCHKLLLLPSTTKWGPYNWTKATFGKEMPSLLHDHLTTECNAVPKDIIQNLSAVANTKNMGKMSLEKFCIHFFAENGMENACGASSSKQTDFNGMVVLDDSECQLDFMSRRSQWMREKGMITKQTTPAVVFEKKNVAPGKVMTNKVESKKRKGGTLVDAVINKPAAQLSGSGSILLINAQTANIAYQLAPLLRLSMSQMELVGAAESELPQNVLRMHLRCKHCFKISCLPSYESWYKAVYNMTHSHLLNSCSHIPKSIRAELKLEQKKGGTRKGMGLRWYCEHLNELFGLKNIQRYSTTPGVCIHDNRSAPSKKKRKRDTEGGDARKKPEGESNKHKQPDSIPASKKRQKISKDSLPTSVGGVVYVDEDGMPMYLPPVGGVPLISSQSMVQARKLSRYHQLLLYQIELFEFGALKTEGKKGTKFVGIRCQNCNSNPKSAFFEPLTTVQEWHKIIQQAVAPHLVNCSCTSLSVQQDLIKLKGKGEKGKLSLKEYCEHLATLYAMENAQGSETAVGGVVWGNCTPIPGGYGGQPCDPSIRPDNLCHTTDSKSVSIAPRHNLMLPQSQDAVGSAATPLNVKETEARKPSPMVLSDYNFLLASQLQFVPIQRHISQSHLNSKPLTMSMRQRTRQNSQSPPPSGVSPSTVVSTDVPACSLSGKAVGIRCKHCLMTKSISSIEACANNNVYQYYQHFSKCPKFPTELMDKIDDCKHYQAMQRTPTITGIAVYCRKVMVDVYNMEDLEWNGVSGGVGFTSNHDSVEGGGIAALPMAGGRKVDANSVILPVIVDGIVEPATMGLDISGTSEPAAVVPAPAATPEAAVGLKAKAELLTAIQAPMSASSSSSAAAAVVPPHPCKDSKTSPVPDIMAKNTDHLESFVSCPEPAENKTDTKAVQLPTKTSCANPEEITTKDCGEMQAKAKLDDSACKAPTSVSVDSNASGDVAIAGESTESAGVREIIAVDSSKHKVMVDEAEGSGNESRHNGGTAAAQRSENSVHPFTVAVAPVETFEGSGIKMRDPSADGVSADENVVTAQSIIETETSSKEVKDAGCEVVMVAGSSQGNMETSVDPCVRGHEGPKKITITDHESDGTASSMDANIAPGESSYAGGGVTNKSLSQGADGVCGERDSVAAPERTERIGTELPSKKIVSAVNQKAMAEEHTKDRIEAPAIFVTQAAANGHADTAPGQESMETEAEACSKKQEVQA